MNAAEIRKVLEDNTYGRVDGTIDEAGLRNVLLAEIAIQLAVMNERAVLDRRLAYRYGLADGISACLTPEINPHWPEDCAEAREWWARFKEHHQSCNIMQELRRRSAGFDHWFKGWDQTGNPEVRRLCEIAWNAARIL